jgi:hypothetical protein
VLTPVIEAGMAGARIFIALTLVVGCHGVTPVQKVLEMMNEMHAKGEKMMFAEEKTYRQYSDWYDDQVQMLGLEIKQANMDIEKLTAFIAKADSDVARLGDEIAKLNAELTTTEDSKAEATSIRESQHAEYLKVSTDYAESVDALERAIQVMQSRNYDVPEAEALLQKMAVGKPGMQRVLAAFIQTGQTDSGSGAPSVSAYKFQSDNIIALLEKFLVKFKGELDEVQTEESNEAHNYGMEMIHMSDTIDYLKKEIAEKSIFKAKRAAESAQAKGDLASTKADKAADEKTLADCKATYAAKTDQYHENQEVRKQELEAISKAIEIISSPDVEASYGEHINLYLAQMKPSFLQIRSARSRVTAKNQVASFLRKKAQLLSSQTLKDVAAEIESNPFDKVIGLIKDLLARLKEEAAAEADHKQWCDQQLHDNKLKREKKTAQVNSLTASIEALTADIDAMAKKIATLAKEQADLTKAMAEATEQRQQEKATNEDTMKDAKAGEDATKAALVILKEFYASQSSLMQQVPEMAAYKGMQSAKGGVIGMLEVITSDFARLFAETKTAEDAAAAEYKQFMEDGNAELKAKHKLEFETSLKKDQAEYERGELNKDLKMTQEELDKALAYQQYLSPLCLEIHVSYEERVKRRNEEIEALRQAYDILDKKEGGTEYYR